eukprot:scaffold23142_cov33-Tisochrysis_lutea.AAC.2
MPSRRPVRPRGFLGVVAHGTRCYRARVLLCLEGRHAQDSRWRRWEAIAVIANARKCGSKGAMVTSCSQLIGGTTIRSEQLVPCDCCYCGCRAKDRMYATCCLLPCLLLLLALGAICGRHSQQAIIETYDSTPCLHSKKRHTLGQVTVERLIRCHANLLLDDLLKDWQSHVLPWEPEMMVEDPDSPERMRMSSE